MHAHVILLRNLLEVDRSLTRLTVETVANLRACLVGGQNKNSIQVYVNAQLKLNKHETVPPAD